MKNLNEIYKVEELNEMEMSEVNGGCVGCNVIDAIAEIAKMVLHLTRR